VTGGWRSLLRRSFAFKHPTIRSLSIVEAIEASSRFFSNDLDKTGLRRINKSIGHRFATGFGLLGVDG
jgi:hypothetical protein